MTLPTALDTACRAATSTGLRAGGFYSPVVGKSAVDGIHTTRKEASAARQVRADIPDQQAQAFCRTHGRANRMRYSDRRSWVSA